MSMNGKVLDTKNRYTKPIGITIEFQHSLQGWDLS